MDVLTHPALLATAVTVGGGAWMLAGRLRRMRHACEAGGEGVMRDLSRHLGLSHRQRRSLKLAARAVNVQHPAVLLLCPSLLRAARQRLPRPQRRSLDQILLRLSRVGGDGA